VTTALPETGTGQKQVPQERQPAMATVPPPFGRKGGEQFAKVEIPLPEELRIGNKRLSVR